VGGKGREEEGPFVMRGGGCERTRCNSFLGGYLIDSFSFPSVALPSKQRVHVFLQAEGRCEVEGCGTLCA